MYVWYYINTWLLKDRHSFMYLAYVWKLLICLCFLSTRKLWIFRVSVQIRSHKLISGPRFCIVQLDHKSWGLKWALVLFWYLERKCVFVEIWGAANIFHIKKGIQLISDSIQCYQCCQSYWRKSKYIYQLLYISNPMQNSLNTRRMFSRWLLEGSRLPRNVFTNVQRGSEISERPTCANV